MARIEKKSAPASRVLDSEADLIKRIHRRIGGAQKLTQHEDPTYARDVVLKALADVATIPADKKRIERGELTPLERRVVRTVTNRCAAVRSRTRQRRELVFLREELQRKKRQVKQLQVALNDVVNINYHVADISPIPSLLFSASSCSSEFIAPSTPLPICTLDRAPMAISDDRDFLCSVVDSLVSPVAIMGAAVDTS